MSSFFLGCFVFGLLFTVGTFLLGAFGSGNHVHLPGADLHGGGVHGSAHVSAFNLSTISAFLAWFGGAGFLLVRYSGLGALAVLLTAIAAGVVGGGIIFVTLTRFVLPRLTVMRPEDYRLEGTLARVASPIVAGGTGEVVYTLGGARHADGARSVTGEALDRGEQVVILRRERGIAYVERWDKFARQHALPAETDPS